VSTYFQEQVPDILSSLADVLLGLFIMFFLMYYAFIDGEKWVYLLKSGLPLEKEHKERLFEKLGSITSAVMHGQFLSAFIQGSLGGLMFFVFGVPNPIFWGAIMIILSFIPLMGTPIVWVPAAIIMLMQGYIWQGIGILIIGSTIVMNIDNIIKPYLIGSRAKISALIVVIGVFGGLKLFGFIGILIGPLLLALLQTVIDLFRERPKESKKKIKKT
jgi:predicted PurR-regulated permease PerM